MNAVAKKKNSGEHAGTVGLSDNQKVLMTLDEVAQMTGLSRSWLRKLVMRKQIPHIHVGRLVRFFPEDVKAWLRKGARSASVSR